MLSHNLIQALWCVIATCVLYISMVGWGWWLSRLLKILRPADISLLAAWGLALSAVLGGVFNLFDIISLSFVRSYIFLGVLSFIFLVFGNQGKIYCSIRDRIGSIFQDPVTILLFIVLVTLLGMRISSAGFKAFNTHDDFYSYLVMPMKMIQSGSVDATAFNERRMSVLGGQSFLHALVIGLLEIRHLNVLDLGFGWLLLTGLVTGHSLQKSFRARPILCFLLVCQFINIPSVNMSSVVTGCALFYALIRTILLTNNEARLSRILLISLIVAGSCSLKNSYFIVSAILLVFVSITNRDHSLFENSKTLAITGVVTCIFLFPWMFNLYQNNGTFLFPIFGLGFQGGAYGDYPSVAVGDLTLRSIMFSLRYPISQSIFFLGLLLVLMNFLQRRDRADFIFAWVLFFSTWASGLVLWITSGGIARYLFPTICATTLFFLADYVSYRKPFENRNAYGKPLFLIILLIASLLGFRGFSGIYNYAHQQRLILNSGLQWSEKDQRQIRAAQATVPAEEKILTRLSKPFLMDFSRNAIFVIDSPGGASLPPGLPCFGTSGSIVRYLSLNEFRFLIYSYKEEAGFPRDKFIRWAHLKGGGYISRVRTATLNTLAFQQRLNTLGQLYPKVYDDGGIFVLRVNSQSS